MFRESERIRKKTPKVSFFVNSPIWTEKEITYHRMDDSSNTLTSVKKTRLLVNIFVFRELEKGLKRNPWGFFTQCHILRAWKESKIDSMTFSFLKNPKKRWKEVSMTLLYTMSIFTSLERNLKWTQTFHTCYSGFHHSRWITLCMAFPCPVAESLDPMDHILSFDVSLIIPKTI